MPRNRRDRGNAPVSTPAQQDEADVVAEVGAERDESSGELVAAEARIREVGAVSSEAIIENRRIQEIVDKKRGGVAGIQFNVDDPLLQYETVIKVWPPNTLDISVKRLTGAPKSDTITSRPRSGVELYEAIKAIHGEYEEASYALKFWDTHGKQIRGNGQITMPDTRPPKPPQGQPMQPYPYGHPGYPPVPPGPPQQAAQAPVVQVVPPSTDPMAMMNQMFKLFQQMQQSVQQPPQPAPQPVAPPSPAPTPAAPSTDPVSMMQQLFQMFQQMQSSMQQPPSATAQPQPPPGASPAPTTTDPMSMMQQMFQQMQQGVAAPQGAARAPQPAAPPQPAPAPPTDPLAMMQQMFNLFQQMQASTIQAMGGAVPGPGGRPGPMYRGPYTAPRYPQDHGGGQGYQPPQHQPPQQPKSAADQFRESISVLRTAAEAVAEVQSLLPGQAPQPEPLEPEEDVSPVKVMDVGDYKLVLDRRDGHARLWETGWANMGNILKWAGEQREAIQKANTARQQPKQQLPPGYVEVGPGYVPPPGYGYVVEQPPQQQQLPQPPAQMPPPISPPQPAGGGESASDPQQRRAWGPPSIPGEG